MSGQLAGKEKREFLRYDYSSPIKYNIINTGQDKGIISKLLIGISQNLSAAGILFTSNISKLPGISTVLALELDYSMTNVCQEIENEALILNNKIIGRVVRIEENDDGTCGVGVAFVKKNDTLLNDIKNIETFIK
ncbi:MAG: PilZ domain-containing protein [Candidatus Omnitrophota bacterium]